MTASLIRKSSTSIDSRYGKRPEDRTIEDFKKSGIVVIDKPMGPTSHQVAAWVRDIIGAEKAGHGGTLDPRATGVLPVGLGNAVRAMDYIHESGKRYVGLMKLHGEIDNESLSRVMNDFKGEIFQTPPVRSAVKRSMRTRTIEDLRMIELDGRNVLFDVKCQGGTYIRTLCVDIGDALGIGAHLQELRRTEAGPFTEKNSISLHALKDATEFWTHGNAQELKRIVIPMEEIFTNWNRIVVKDSAIDSLCHGAELAIPGIVEFTKGIKKGERLAFYSTKGEIIATGKSVLSAGDIVEKKDGAAAVLERVFMEPGTYPKSWSSKG